MIALANGCIWADKKAQVRRNKTRRPVSLFGRQLCRFTEYAPPQAGNPGRLRDAGGFGKEAAQSYVAEKQVRRETEGRNLNHGR